MQTCRFCTQPLNHVFADLGMSPLANSYVPREQTGKMEPFYPLCAYVCSDCLLVQLPEIESAQAIFSDYAYFSSFSESWLRHAQSYVTMMIERFGYHPGSQVIEIASNDGYLLQYFQAAGIPVLGVEPARNVAKAAIDAGIPTLPVFFGSSSARELKAEGRQADLLIGNNVLAHVPDLNDFVEGLKIALKPEGLITLEFPHLLQLMDQNQFDTIYHEHFSYFSFLVVNAVFNAHDLKLFDVEQLSTHGGSLRIFGCHAQNERHALTDRARALLSLEKQRGLDRIEAYLGFNERVKTTKRAILEFMLAIAAKGETIVGYGAPAKGNTLLNYCGIRTDLLPYTVDRSPHKQNHYLPGTRIPIDSPERIALDKPDYILILPWNLKEEIIGQMAHARQWGGRFVTLIPKVEVHP